jgi:hypothetical protein
MAELFLRRTKFAVNSWERLLNCPKFENLMLLFFCVQSAGSEDTFQVFVSVPGGTDLAITTENLNDLCLLREEFGLVARRFKVSEFQSAFRRKPIFAR